jgi:polar amino acid transport system substrate-binding protein
MPDTKIIEQIRELWSLRQQLIDLCNNHPVLATILIAVLLVVAGHMLITTFTDLIKRVASWTQSTRGRIGTGIGALAIVAVAVIAVIWINVSSSPVPIFTPDVKHYLLGEHIYLKWAFAGAGRQQTPILYEVESAADDRFSNVKNEGYVEDGYKPIRDWINGTRYWRVRAVDTTEEHNPVSDWSSSHDIEQYESALKRIEVTKSFRIYMSKSVEQGIFRFISPETGKPRGFDVRLAETIADQLAAKMQLAPRLKVVTNNVTWEELLNAPSAGVADMIISTISVRPQREEQFKLKFSRPYYQTTQSLIYRCGEADRPIRERLRGKRVGVQTGTTSEHLLTALRKDLGDQAPTLVQFLQNDYLSDELLKASPTIDYGIADTPFAKGTELKHRENGASLLGYKEFTTTDFTDSVEPEQRIENYAVAVRSADAKLLQFINEIIDGLIQSGERDRMLEQATRDLEQMIHPNGGSGTGCPAAAVSR